MRLSMQDIYEAVNDPLWQHFRKSLKGVSTEAKIGKLKEYLKDVGPFDSRDFDSTKPYIRVQNYINALSRGGQIEPTDRSLSVRRQLEEVVIKRLQSLPNENGRRYQ